MGRITSKKKEQKHSASKATDPTSIMTHEHVEGVKIQNAAISNVHVQNLNAKFELDLQPIQHLTSSNPRLNIFKISCILKQVFIFFQQSFLCQK
jgi:hypothetical protein